MFKKEITLKENKIFEGKVLKYFVNDVKCPNGNISKREIVRHPGGACILAVIDGKVCLERQYRYPFDDVILELPAGKLEKNEAPDLAAKREFEEETGLKAKNIVSLGRMYPSVGYTDEVIHLFFVSEIEEGKQNLDDDEFVNIEFIDLDKVLKMIDSGEITDAKTIIAILKYIRLYGN